jgi:3-deoxy-D-manno-octulosonic-acid transferase
MLRALYNTALLVLALLSVPRWFYKKHRRSFLQRLGLKLPLFTFTKKGPRIWIHSISMGETKAALPLIKQLQDRYPDASIVISTITETGYNEALSAQADHTFYLPLDFSWTIRKLMARIKPDLLILVEGDFWFNLINLAPCVALVNGKISEKSLARFKKVPFFSRPLFSKIELFCVQSPRFADRFAQLGVDPRRIVVTGNLKFDQSAPSINTHHLKEKLGLSPADRVITIGSTHHPEEKLLLEALAPLLEKYLEVKILVVPRHPERFGQVAALIKGKERITLVDTMGILTACYQISELAIVGGSFAPHLEGHNIFEPAAIGIPVIFGPWMGAQKDLVELILEAGAGLQVTLDQIAPTIDGLLSHPPRSMGEAGLKLANQMQGATARTLKALERLLRNSSLSEAKVEIIRN